MKKFLGLTLALVFVASYVRAQATATTVTNRGEVITVYTAEGGGSTNAAENTEQGVPADFRVGDDLIVTDDASVGGDLTVTGATIANDVDARTATTLLLGKATATRVEIGDTGIVIEAEGPLTATEDILSNELDAETATALLLGKATATGVTVGAADAHTTIAGNLLASDVDAATAATLLLGKATATKVEIADTGIETEIQGTLDAQEAATFASTVGVTGVLTLTAAPKLTAVTANGSATATMTNAPAAGNPAAWANVSIGTNTYVIPLFAAE